MTAPSATSTLLQKPASELAVSPELLAALGLLASVPLGQVLADYTTADLLRLPGFDYRALKELYSVLQALGCEQALRE